MDLFRNLKKSVGLSNNNDCDHMQESYNRYINSNNYGDMEVDEI